MRAIISSSVVFGNRTTLAWLSRPRNELQLAPCRLERKAERTIVSCRCPGANRIQFDYGHSVGDLSQCSVTCFTQLVNNWRCLVTRFPDGWLWLWNDPRLTLLSKERTVICSKPRGLEREASSNDFTPILNRNQFEVYGISVESQTFISTVTRQSRSRIALLRPTIQKSPTIRHTTLRYKFIPYVHGE